MLGAPSRKTGDEIKSCSRSSRTTIIECCVLKTLFSLVWHTKMSSVFGSGQSTNSMARIMKADQMSKVCASSHEYPHAEKKSRNFVNRISKVRWPGPADCHGKRIYPQGKKKNLRAKRKTLRQKEKPHGQNKNLTAKRKTSRQKEKDSRQKE